MRVAIMCNTKSSEYPNRPELIELFNEKSIQVFFAAIFDGTVNDYFKNNNMTYYLPIKASRNNINPIKEIMSLIDVRNQIKQNSITAAVIYGVKNHPSMAIGSFLGGAKNIVCVVNGRGNLFNTKGLKGLILRSVALPMLKLAYMVSSKVCFQNEDDAAYFTRRKLVNKKKVFCTNGSGVNTTFFENFPMPEDNEFLYMARITPSKGIVEYIEAAKRMKKKYPSAKFHVVGPIDDLIEGSCKKQIEEASRAGYIQYHGKTDNVREWLRRCRYFVYPSYYPEGVPRCVLQALSIGRPVITCNTAGCKKTVIDGKNGFLIESKNVDQLIEKMCWLIEHTKESNEMGNFSRKIAEEKFNVRMINKKIMYELLEESK